MAKTNGTVGLILKIIGVVLTFTAMVVGGVLALGNVDKCVEVNKTAIKVNSDDIEGMKHGLENYIWPEVKLNSKHRTDDEVDTPYIKRDIAEIKKNVDDFRAEQRMVNNEILRKLEQ